MSEGSEYDEVLALELADALRRTSPLVAGVAARAKSAFTWRTVDDDLLMAELMFDSAYQAVPSPTRADDDGTRVLVFAAELRSVEVEVLSDRVLGQFTPQSTGEVEVLGDSGVVARVDVDDLGFFVIEPVPTGIVRLRCTTPTTRFLTDWVRL